MQPNKFFTLREMTNHRLQLENISNTPSGTHQSNLVLLCQNILQPLRDY